MRNIDKLHERSENMILNPTVSEAKFMHRLDMNGIKYTTQKVIGNYIVDFVINRIIIEIDGRSHYEPIQAQYDKDRTKYLESLNYTVIRVRNEHVLSFNINRIRKKVVRDKIMCPKNKRNPKLSNKEKAQLKVGKHKKCKVIEFSDPIIEKKPKVRFTYAKI